MHNTYKAAYSKFAFRKSFVTDSNVYCKVSYAFFLSPCYPSHFLSIHIVLMCPYRILVFRHSCNKFSHPSKSSRINHSICVLVPVPLSVMFSCLVDDFSNLSTEDDTFTFETGEEDIQKLCQMFPHAERELIADIYLQTNSSLAETWRILSTQ